MRLWLLAALLWSTLAQNATPETALRKLETAGAFPSGGELAFAEGETTLIGRSQFIAFPTADTAPNFAFGGTLQLNSQASDELEACALVARTDIERGTEETDTEITTFAQINTFIDIGITNAGGVYIADRYGADADDLMLATFDADLDTDAPVTLVAVLLDDALTVFADGELVAEGVAVEAPPGGFALAINSYASDTTCDGTNLWAYTLPADYVDDGCEITTDGTINQRAGAGTNFDVRGQLAVGEVAQAVGQTTDADGFVWWYLENNLWMREDVVIERGYCRTLPPA